VSTPFNVSIFPLKLLRYVDIGGYRPTDPDDCLPRIVRQETRSSAPCGYEFLVRLTHKSKYS